MKRVILEIEDGEVLRARDLVQMGFKTLGGDLYAGTATKLLKALTAGVDASRTPSTPMPSPAAWSEAERVYRDFCAATFRLRQLPEEVFRMRPTDLVDQHPIVRDYRQAEQRLKRLLAEAADARLSGTAAIAPEPGQEAPEGGAQVSGVR